MLIFFWSKIAIHLSLGLRKGRPSYRWSLQPAKENIQHFKTWNSLTFSIFVGHFFPPGSRSGSNNLIESRSTGSGTLVLKIYGISSISGAGRVEVLAGSRILSIPLQPMAELGKTGHPTIYERILEILNNWPIIPDFKKRHFDAYWYLINPLIQNNSDPLTQVQGAEKGLNNFLPLHLVIMALFLTLCYLYSCRCLYRKTFLIS